MSLTTKVLLRKDRQKRDGKCPLAIRITYNRKIAYLSLGYSLLEKDFDDKNQRIRTTSKAIDNTTRFNNLINKKVKRVYDVISELEVDETAHKFNIADIQRKVFESDESNAQRAVTMMVI